VLINTLPPRQRDTRQCTSGQQINQLEGLALARAWGFESALPHHSITAFASWRAGTICVMSVASHLAVSPAKYDARIRSLIPLYDELIAEVARALGHAARPVRIVVDLGIGTGALARACLDGASGVRVWGIDADPDMMAIARTRLGRLSRRVMMTTGSFLDVALPSCDAIVASYSLHHIRTPRAKLAFYRRCYRALRPGGVLINGDCAPASTPRGFARDLDVWFAHLGKTFGSRTRGRRVYKSWADEDMYLPLAEEIRLLERAGFGVDVPWRRSPFAVIVGCRHA
jgi:SAM-dependent methyltransferase